MNWKWRSGSVVIDQVKLNPRWAAMVLMLLQQLQGKSVFMSSTTGAGLQSSWAVCLVEPIMWIQVFFGAPVNKWRSNCPLTRHLIQTSIFFKNRIHIVNISVCVPVRIEPSRKRSLETHFQEEKRVADKSRVGHPGGERRSLGNLLLTLRWGWRHGSFTRAAACIWWRGCGACGSWWCSWWWGSNRPPGQTRTCAAESTRWFWSGRRQSSPRCSGDVLRGRAGASVLNHNNHHSPTLKVWKRGFPLTSSKWDVGKLLPSGRIVVEVAVGVELQPLLPGVVKAVVDGRGDADLVANRDGVSRCRLEGKGNSVWRKLEKERVYTLCGTGVDEVGGGALTCGERAILIMVMMGGRRRRVSFRQRSNKPRSLSCW